MSAAQVQIKPFHEEDEVWLPVVEVQKHYPHFSPSTEAAVVHGKIFARVAGEEEVGTRRTWAVDVYGLTDRHGTLLSVPVSSRRLKRHTKILVIRIGDWETEPFTLDPLASSLRAQLSLLLPPDFVQLESIRTLEELRGALRLHGGGLTPSGRRQASPWGYVILVGHGRGGDSPGIRFGNRWETPLDIAHAIRGLGPGRRSFAEGRFLSLCCESGAPSFGDVFSDALSTTWAGPGIELHSYEAAAWIQRFFFEHFLGGRTWTAAFRRTVAATADFSTQFSCWLNGGQVQGAD